MILLTSVSDLVQVITVSTLAIKVHASFVDLNGTTVTPGRTNTLISTATTTSVIGSPASSTTRNVKTLFVNNTSTTTSEVITVQHTDGTNVVIIWSGTLNAGDVFQYNENDGITVIDDTGTRKLASATGRLIKTTLLTTGTSFVTSAETNSIMVKMVGGGGGGGGCTSVALAASYGGGGGGGAYSEKLFAVTPLTVYPYAIGTAGAGASGAAGGNGGATSFTVLIACTAPGGTGAVVATATTVVGTTYPGGAGGVAGANGDINAPGQAGAGGLMQAVTPLGTAGAGGWTLFGEGGVGVTAVGNGTSGTGFGAGGSGAATGASTLRTGGSGTAGCILVHEFT